MLLNLKENMFMNQNIKFQLFFIQNGFYFDFLITCLGNHKFYYRCYNNCVYLNTNFPHKWNVYLLTVWAIWPGEERKEINWLMFLCPVQILNIKHCVINNLYSKKGSQDQAPDKKALDPETLAIFQKCPKAIQ